LNSPNKKEYTRYSVFSVSGKLFGLEMSTVREVLSPPKVTLLPNVPTHVLGVYNLRGSILSLVDIQRILGLNSTNKKETDMVMLVESSRSLISFIVEKVLDFVEVENSKIQEPSKNISARLAYFVRGIYDTNTIGQIYLLETENFLNSNVLFIQDS
jgi:purine-binding chemotaxis protein CheW